MRYNSLTPEERHIIEMKKTEVPFSGEYDQLFKEGVYICRKCNAPLFTSAAKFDAGCGWPAFDSHYPKAVKRLPDGDGQRVETQCSNCSAHLGHVFEGEQYTKTNTRHCVNSLSIRFVPKDTQVPETIHE